jgi:serine/threonine protein phosphatase PrpC
MERRDKFVIIATDGLWDHLSPREAVRIADEALYCPDNQGSDSEAAIRAACRSLIDHALQKVCIT